MQINKFKKIGKNKYKMFLENLEIILFEETILKYNLLIIKDIDIKLLDEIVEDNRYYESYYLALNYIDIKMRSKTEIIEYLKRKQIDDIYIDFTINKIDKMGLLNDDKYIQAYINDKINLSNYGPYKIKRELLNSEFNENDIDNYLSRIDDTLWVDKLKKMIDKKVSSYKNKSYYMLINKIRSDMFNLGYENEMVDDILSKVKYDNSNIKKEYEKIKRRLGSKQKIISFLLRKGYAYEEINNLFNEE